MIGAVAWIAGRLRVGGTVSARCFGAYRSFAAVPVYYDPRHDDPD